MLEWFDNHNVGVTSVWCLIMAIVIALAIFNGAFAIAGGMTVLHIVYVVWYLRRHPRGSSHPHTQRE